MKTRIEVRSKWSRDQYAGRAHQRWQVPLPTGAATDTSFPYHAGSERDDGAPARSMWRVDGSYWSRVVRQMLPRLLPTILPFLHAPHEIDSSDIEGHPPSSLAGLQPVPSDRQLPHAVQWPPCQDALHEE